MEAMVTTREPCSFIASHFCDSLKVALADVMWIATVEIDDALDDAHD